jgi:hypothetical protein
LQESVTLIPSLTLKMEALSSTEYIIDLSEGRSKQPNQRLAKTPALYFGDSGFKLRWANPELSLFFLDPASHVPKFYFKSCYNRFLSYSCQLFTYKSYYHSLRAELLWCSSIPGRGRKCFLMQNIQGVCGNLTTFRAISDTGCFRRRKVALA